MNRNHLWNHPSNLMALVAIFLATTVAGCGPIHQEEFDGGRGRVTRSHPAQYAIGIGLGVLGAATAASLSGGAENPDQNQQLPGNKN